MEATAARPDRFSAESDDPVQTAIDRAKADILAIDTFLKGGEQSPRIAIRSAREIRDEH